MGPHYAGILGPLAFVIVLSRGVIDGDSAQNILLFAAISLIAFSALGYLTGRIADQILWDSLKKQFQDELQTRGSSSSGKTA